VGLLHTINQSVQRTRNYRNEREIKLPTQRIYSEAEGSTHKEEGTHMTRQCVELKLVFSRSTGVGRQMYNHESSSCPAPPSNMDQRPPPSSPNNETPAPPLLKPSLRQDCMILQVNNELRRGKIQHLRDDLTPSNAQDARCSLANTGHKVRHGLWKSSYRQD
jgi:hypothetical protein